MPESGPARWPPVHAALLGLTRREAEKGCTSNRCWCSLFYWRELIALILPNRSHSAAAQTGPPGQLPDGKREHELLANVVMLARDIVATAVDDSGCKW
jgi:hypothetical protein